MDSGLGIGGHSKSIVEMTTSKFDYDSPYVREKGVKKAYRIEESKNFSKSGPIEFEFEADAEKWTDMETMAVKGKVGIEVKKNGKWVSVAKDSSSSTAKWGLINNTFSSLFTSVVIKINDCVIGDSADNTYPYLTYLQTLLGTSASNAGSNILEVRNFIKDKAGKMEKPDTSPTSPFGLRREEFLEREMVDFVIPLHNDLMNAEKYVPPNTKLSVKLKKSPSEFVIWKDDSDTNEYRFVLDDVKLRFKRYEVHDHLLDKYNKEHVDGKHPLGIKYTKNLLKTFNVNAGVTELKYNNLFFGSHLPDRLYMVFVAQDAYSGTDTKNPFNFETIDMKQAYLKFNSGKYPEDTYLYEAKVDEKDLYLELLANTGTGPFEMDSVNVSFKDFKGGYFILAFDRSPTLDNGLYLHKPLGGHMSVYVKVGTKLPCNYEVLVFGSYDSALTFVEDKVIDEAIF